MITKNKLHFFFNIKIVIARKRFISGSMFIYYSFFFFLGSESLPEYCGQFSGHPVYCITYTSRFLLLSHVFCFVVVHPLFRACTKYTSAREASLLNKKYDKNKEKFVDMIQENQPLPSSVKNMKKNISRISGQF